MGYFWDRVVFGKDTANTILASRLIVWLLISGVIMAVAVVGVCYWVYEEVTLELSYQQKYGAGWQAEYERYHGSLAQAHSNILGIAICMFALVGVLSWAFWYFCLKNRKRH